MDEIRVRFAPSPTGYLHVGGARTAIFNWLFARNKGGKFLLRIEDTDPERSKSELSFQIIRSMNWLGMEADEPIIYQALNIKRHSEVVEHLLKTGKAYYAFETPEELEEKRKESAHQKIQYKYNRASLNLTRDAVDKLISEGKPYAVRFKVPEGKTVFEDIVHGETDFNNSEIEDFILMRSDGSPVYQIAVVVDDHDMRISHVIRGDDHLSNTPKQILLYNALGWEVPYFAHLPMILDEHKKKLSKRRNPVAVEEYKDKGYLPEALFNFLTLLGFAPGMYSHVLSPDPLTPLPEGEGSTKQESQSQFKIKTGESQNILPPLSLKERGTGGEVTKNLTPLPGGEVIPSEKREILSREELIKMFTFERVNKSSAVFDMKKLDWINSEYIRCADEESVAELVITKLDKMKLPEESKVLQYVKSVVGLMKERVSTVNDIIEFGNYFFAEPLKYDEKGLTKHWNPKIKPVFTEYSVILKNTGNWAPDALEKDLREFADSKGVKAGELIHLLRLSLTGMTISPGIFELMIVLGKDKVKKRISQFISNTLG